MENKSSRISLNLELVHRYKYKIMNSAINTKYSTYFYFKYYKIINILKIKIMYNLIT